jgi:hypothetical protein
MNPLEPSKTYALTQYVCRQLLLPAGIVGALGAIAGARSRPFALHAAFAFLVAVLTIARMGSHVNYYIECSWAAGLCLGIALTRCSGGLRSCVAYGLAAAIIFQSAGRAWPHVRQNNRELAQWPAVMELVAKYGQCQPIMTMQIGAQMLAGQQPYATDIFQIRLLSERGEFNEEPILRDIREHRFAAVIAADDVRPDCRGYTNWSNTMRQAIATHYRPDLSRGPLTVYVPREKTDLAIRQADSSHWR